MLVDWGPGSLVPSRCANATPQVEKIDRFLGTDGKPCLFPAQMALERATFRLNQSND